MEERKLTYFSLKQPPVVSACNIHRLFHVLLQLPAKNAISTIEATALVWLSTTKKCMVAAWRREEEEGG